MAEATLFVYCNNFLHAHNHIHTINSSIIIRLGPSPSPSLHRLGAQWENLPKVPSLDLNLALPYGKPTNLQPSYVAPYTTELRRTLLSPAVSC
jgi:hypothetical protein